MIKIKNYGYIVNKQFKVNRKRNISTISGIILSIILFTIVGYTQMYNQEVNILEAKSINGDYEATLTNLTNEDIHRLKNNTLVDKVGLYTELYNSTIDIGDKEKNINIYAVDNVIIDDMFKDMINITKGRLPENEDEILLDSVGKEYLYKDIGDILKLGDKSYKVVGYYDKIQSINPYSIEILTYYKQDTNLKHGKAVFNVISKDNKIKDIRKVVNDIGKDENQDLMMNSLLFHYYGEYIHSTINQINQGKLNEILLYCAILILTIFMTYGSINISIKERIEQFSILRCMGATPSKIRALLIRESIFLALLSIVTGIILGQLTCFFIYKTILQNMYTSEIPFIVSKILIWKVVLLSLINIVISTIIPVIKVGKISPIEIVKNGGEVEVKTEIKESKILRKIFGYNGFIAYKNIRGNNKSFLITTITSILILTIFIVFTGYSNTFLSDFNNKKSNIKDATFEVDIGDEDNYTDVLKELDKYKEEIKALGVTKDIYPRLEYFVTGIFEDIVFNKNIKSKINNTSNNIGERVVNINGKTSVFSDMINITILDDDSITQLLSELGNTKVTLEDFKDNGVMISDIMGVENFVNLKRLPLFNLKENEKFVLKIDEKTYGEYSGNLDKQMQKIMKNGNEIELKYLGSVNPKLALNGFGYPGKINLIVSRDFYNNNKNLFNKKNRKAPIEGERINFDIEFKSDINRDVDFLALQNYANKIEAIYTDNEINSINLENSVIVLSKMTYVVLFLTMIVGGLNLINNKYISMKLRNKEIGTLLAIGINKNRLKKIFMLEGIIQWIISTMISLVLSYSILTILFKVLIYTELIVTPHIPVIATIVGCTALFIINVLGVYLPIRKLEYTKTTELIRNKE